MKLPHITRRAALKDFAYVASVGFFLPSHLAAQDVFRPTRRAAAASAGGGGGAALVNTGLIVRYFIDEAASGTAPTALLDASGVGSPFNLALTYASNMTYTEVSGNRGIDSASTTGNNEAVASINDTTDKVRDAVNGAQKSTMEIVLRPDTIATAGGNRIFTLGNNDANTPELGVITASATEYEVVFNTAIQRIWDGAEGSRLVLHVVIDTTQAVATDRVLVYVNGSLISPTVNANPTLNATISLPAGSKMQIINRNAGWGNPLGGAVFYTALYSSAFPQGDVTANYNRLIADDDT